MHDSDMIKLFKSESSVNSSLNDTLNNLSPYNFSLDLNLNGQPINWAKLHWLTALLKDPSHEMVIEKASQMGASTYCLIWAFWLCRIQRAKRGIIYWLPTESDVGDFVNTKVDPFINENDELLGSKSTVGGKSTDNQGLKFMYGTPVFWRGLKSKTKVKSISADVGIFDEFDEADPGQVSQARKRTSASEVKLSRELSTPTIPDFGINRRFDESDQCYYVFKCASCGTHSILEHHFPECFKQHRDGTWYHACYHCKKPLDVSTGRWAQTNTASKLRGYHISQLYSPFVSADEIMTEYQTTEFMGYFHNHVLGLPYLSASDRVSAEKVLSLCDPLRKQATLSQTGTFMGVDVGSKLHVTVISNDSNPKVLYLKEAQSFEELDHIMRAFNVRDCVIDALPETRKAKEFVSRFKTRSWVCFYSEHQKGSYGWNEEERIVSVNRTESLDVGTDMLLKDQITMPQRDPLVEIFANHCGNIAKVIEENKETGEKRYVYKKIGADHFRHSLNYALIARSRNRSKGVASVFR